MVYITMQDECLTGSARSGDLACLNEKEPDLVRRKASDSKFHSVKRGSRGARMLLSSNILFGGASFGRIKKRRKRRSRRDSSGKQDDNSGLLDVGPSTSESKSCPVEEKLRISHVTENSNVVAINQNFRNRIGQDDCVPSSDKRTSVLRPFSSEESRCSDYNAKPCVRKDSRMSMQTRGLGETTGEWFSTSVAIVICLILELYYSSTYHCPPYILHNHLSFSLIYTCSFWCAVPRWDGVELPPSELVDSRITEPVKIGYVADEW